MPTRKKKGRAFARIAITVPPEVLVAADRLALRLDRSRSWVVAEAVRRLAAGVESDGATATAWVAPSPPGHLGAMVAEGRMNQLRSDLDRTPADRLRRAEELVQLGRSVHPRRPRTQIIAFDSTDEFAEWKRSSRIRV